MESSIVKLVNTTLPALSGSKVRYNERSSMLETEKYTSAAGNSYYQGILLNDRIIINFDLGQGYLYLFLNGIRVYGYNGEKKHLIGSRVYSCRSFSKDFALKQTIEIVLDYMTGQMKLLNQHCDENALRKFSKSLVESTYSTMKQIA